jgi:sulfite exporter TauE/SafE
MDLNIWSVLFVGFILGIKGGTEPDHVVAVSTIASQNKKLWKAAVTGVFWGIGHTTTLFAVSIALILFKGEIPEAWALSFEMIVGIMMIYLGFTTIYSLRKRKIHAHVHKHSGVEHMHFHYHQDTETHVHPHSVELHRKPFLIGLIHGLAGSAAMVLLTASSVGSLWEAAMYLFVYGVGTLIGMFACTALISIPFVLSNQNFKLNHSLIHVAGTISFVYGVYLIYSIGFNDGLFMLWLD